MTKPALLAALVLLCSPPSAAFAEEAFDPGAPPPKVGPDYYAGAEKAVYHVTTRADERGYLAILGNIRNHGNALSATGLKPDIKVVINGDGIHLLTLAAELEFDTNARLPIAVKEARDRGVQFLICYTTLTAYRIALDQLYETKAADLVPAGVAEVTRLQKMGYGLVKP